MRTQLPICYDDIISIENLLAAWEEFLRGKREKPDVQLFALRLMDNLLALHRELADFSYIHGGYKHFKISDPKTRDIHKASVRDRLLHHALYRKLYPRFDRTFIADSYSCRRGKGTHRALDRFRALGRSASKNHTSTVWVLQCDIRKCFASIDHAVLLETLAESISDECIRSLLARVVGSFRAPPSFPDSSKPSATAELGRCLGNDTKSRGLPLGNLTSQLFVNVYLNELDQFMKHCLKAKHYLRYADDFAILSPDRSLLAGLIPKIERFLVERLKLTLHPNKLRLRTLASGVDFLGWVHFPDYRVLRTATKRRMFSRFEAEPSHAVVASYHGLLGHGNGYRLSKKIGWRAGVLE